MFELIILNHAKQSALEDLAALILVSTPDAAGVRADASLDALEAAIHVAHAGALLDGAAGGGDAEAGILAADAATVAARADMVAVLRGAGTPAIQAIVAAYAGGAGDATDGIHGLRVKANAIIAAADLVTLLPLLTIKAS